ncbi:unnamed protein product, partial [Prorocentrum cordatum]
QVNALISPACSVPDLVAQLAGCQVKHEQIVALLVKGKVDGNNPAFHTLVRQYMALPAAWHKVPDLLGSERRWTRKFCDTLDDEDAKVLAMTHDTFAFTKLYGLPPATIVEVVGVFLERIRAKGGGRMVFMFRPLHGLLRGGGLLPTVRLTSIPCPGRLPAEPGCSVKSRRTRDNGGLRLNAVFRFR